MAWTSVGFDGTITEIQWAGLAGLLGNGYVAAGNGDCLVTAVSGARSVSVAAGSLYGDGVLSTNSGAETVALTTPTNGQWYVIALRRTWASNTAALVAIAGATTTTTTPTAAPTSFPTMNTNVGVLTDQPIAWAWCNSANTTVVVFDIRLKAVKSLPPVVATSAERDAKFMSPTQGLQVWRDDLGAVETYYTAYNSSTNPGGRDTAGWYKEDRQTSLIPIRATSAVISSGTGSTNSLGVITFTNATSVLLNGIFTSDYANYKIICRLSGSTATGTQNVVGRMAAGGVTNSTAGVYYTGGFSAHHDGTYGNYAAVDNQFYLMPFQTMNWGNFTADLQSPAIAIRTTLNLQGSGYDGKVSGIYAGSLHDIASAYDGFEFRASSGTISGTVQILGYND